MSFNDFAQKSTEFRLVARTGVEIDGELKFLGKFKQIGSLTVSDGSLVNDTFIIQRNEPAVPNPKAPNARLLVNFEEGPAELCGMYLSEYDDGTSYLRGKDAHNAVEYRVYIPGEESERKRATFRPF